jgi:putative ABC transport system permease protein
LFWQFISESLLVSFAAVLIAVGIAYLLLPLFNVIAGKALVIDFAQHPEWIFALIGIWLTISLLGGSYPAIVLSSFSPAKVLKGKLANVGSGAILRKSLVVFQFGVSIFLIVCTLTISDQLTYMMNSKIGIDKEQLIVIPLDRVSGDNIAAIRNEFATVAGVEQSAAINTTPVNIGSKTTVRDGDVGEKQLMIFNVAVEPTFVKTIGLEIISGTDLSPEIPKDTTWEYLLNESAVGFFGWTNETAIGKKMSMWGQPGVVKGVVRDFHFSALHKPIEPLLIHAGMTNEGFINNLVVRVQGENFEAITSAMAERWKKIVPASPFSFNFVNEQYDNLYKSESRLSRVMNVFSVLAILIAGLGLFGLASYTIMQRTKELGIRKVLGASLSGLLLVVSSGFIRLIVLSFVIATPISWYVMDDWLEHFAYPVGFNWAIVIGAGALAVLIAAGTVFYHAYEAARINPAQTLRSE